MSCRISDLIVPQKNWYLILSVLMKIDDGGSVDWVEEVFTIVAVDD